MLTITTTHQPATDLGYLLHKHPDRLQTFDISSGKAHVFYPQADEDRCTAALFLSINPIDLTPRGNRGRNTPASLLQDYVNDRPYTASSHLSVAIAKVFGTALSGRCNDRPELAGTPIPLEATITSVHSRYGSELITRLFAPLGYCVDVQTPPLDPAFPEWGDSQHHNITVSADTHTLRELLVHLYVLLPALDNQKHYWINEDEADKLIRFGEGWLDTHPLRNIISRRYLRHRPNLVDRAQDRFTPEDSEESPSQDQEHSVTKLPTETDLERPGNLQQQRVEAILGELRDSGAASVLDLGCGAAQLITELLKEPQFTSITGVEVSLHTLTRAKRQTKETSTDPGQDGRLKLLHGSLTYRDPRLEGADAAVAMEVIEHIEPSKLKAFEDSVLTAARPATLIVTTPNREYNVLFNNFDRPLRHRDHRFEWTRKEFRAWANPAAARNGYSVRYEGIGEEHPEHGHPTQMAVFTLPQGEKPAP